MRKIITNLFIGGTLILMAIDGLPAFGSWHERLKEKADTMLDVLGLWQGEWGLFAPEPLKVTRRVGVEIICADGTKFGWGSPQWEGVGQLDRFTGFRSAEFYEAITMDENEDAWPCFLDYMVEDYGRKTCGAQNIVQAKLIRYFQLTPPPGQRAGREQSVVIFSKNYKP